MIHDHAFTAAAVNSCDPVLTAPAPLPDDNRTDPPPAGAQPFITLPPLLGPSRRLDRAALAAVLAKRVEQVEQHGHTAAADDAADLHDLTRHAGRHLRAMNEYASLGRIEGTRLYAVKLSAHALAVAESCDRRLARLATLGLGTVHG